MTPHTTKDPIRLLQVSDTHLYGNSSGTLLKMNTHDSFARVLEMVGKNESDIDLVLATGDICQDASRSAYSFFLERMQEINAPLRWIPGNHDDASVMEEIGDKDYISNKNVSNKNAGTRNVNNKKMQINNWLLLLLDSSVPGQVHGKLSAAELDFLEESLGEAEKNDAIEHCLIALHHNPTKANAGWMKDIGLHNAETFFDIISGVSKTRCVIYGHIHQELDFQHRGIRCLCTPSTCIQFKPGVNNFELDRMNPGYRNIRLHKNGEIDTRVYRLEGSVLQADFGSAGY